MMYIGLFHHFFSHPSLKSERHQLTHGKKNLYKTFVNRWEMWFTALGNKGENADGNKDQMKDVKVILSNRVEKLQRIPALKKKLQTQTCQHDGGLGCCSFQSHLRELKAWQHEIIQTFGKSYRAALWKAAGTHESILLYHSVSIGSLQDLANFPVSDHHILVNGTYWNSWSLIFKSLCVMVNCTACNRQ